LLRIRYFPSSSLFLEPLGTIYMMHPGGADVNMKIAFPTDKIRFGNKDLHVYFCGRGVYKTGAAGHVLI
jgi:hypothetical protein